MDQRQTTEAELYERAFPSRDLAYYLGTLLNAPMQGVPTVEDLQREQGLIGIPTREQSNRRAGQDILDWAAQAFGLGSILRGSAAGRQQDLMSKGRGRETFGKEMMDTSRRAQPQRWREMLDEDLAPAERPMRQGHGRILPPGETPVWRRGEMKPADVVEKGTWKSPRAGEVDAYRIGEPVPLPGGQQAQYLVVPSGTGASVVLDTGAGQRQSVVVSAPSIGEALAKARQLQNRLALAGKELAQTDWHNPFVQKPFRTTRLPWERSSRDWPVAPFDPPRQGRWNDDWYNPNVSNWPE